MEKNPYYYDRQQAALEQVAADLGLVIFRPNYHGKGTDANTVLFYTQEAEAFNQTVDYNPLRPDYEQYKPYVWCFENTDPNGRPSYNWANRGRIDLYTPYWETNLRHAAGKALLDCWRKQQPGCETQERYNAMTQDIINAYRMYTGEPVFVAHFVSDMAKEAFLARYPMLGDRFAMCTGAIDSKLLELTNTWANTGGRDDIDAVINYIENQGGIPVSWYND